MVMAKKIIILAPLLLISLLSVEQNCYKFHESVGCRVKNTIDFKPFGQSRSAVVEAGKTYQYQVVFFGGYDYKIGICTEKGFGPIHIKIINKQDQTVFYDNLDDDYVESVGFSNEVTKNAILEITITASEMEFNDIGDNRVCLGIAIYWHKIPKMGIGNE